MYRAVVLTEWRVVNDANEIGVALDYPTPYGWTDITGQPDAEIPTNPNLFVAEGRLDDDAAGTLEADSAYDGKILILGAI